MVQGVPHFKGLTLQRIGELGITLDELRALEAAPAAGGTTQPEARA